MFLTVEGVEGSGKSTLLDSLAARLEAEGRSVMRTREPGGSSLGAHIRPLVLSAGHKPDPRAELFLFLADRAQHVAEVVKPALAAGTLVLCDRYADSTIAYQGYGRGLDMEFWENINSYAVQNFMPDVALFLDIPPAAAFERKHGADENDRIEQPGAAFHKKVYEGYRELLNKFPGQLLPVDCSGSKYQTHEKIVALLKDRGLI